MHHTSVHAEVRGQETDPLKAFNDINFGSFRGKALKWLLLLFRNFNLKGPSSLTQVMLKVRSHLEDPYVLFHMVA